MAHVITDECLACGACADTCPVGAISMDDAKGIYVVNDECVDCGACERLPRRCDQSRIIAKKRHSARYS